MQIQPISQLITKNLKKDQYEKYLELIPNFKSAQAQKYTTIILSLGASIILGLFAILPTVSTIANLQRQLDDDKFLEQKLQQKITNLNSLQAQYQSIQSDLPIIFDAIPKDSQIPLFLAQIQAAAKSTNITLDNFQTFKVALSKKQLVNKKYSSYDFGIKIHGDYQSMINFLSKISNFQRIITVNIISITKSTENNNSILQLNIKGSAYFKN